MPRPETTIQLLEEPEHEAVEWYTTACIALAPKGVRPERYADHWERITLGLMNSWEATLALRCQLEALTKEVLLVKNRLHLLEESQPLTVPVDTLAPEPYEITRPVRVVVHKAQAGYIATFFDAGLSASGDTDVEAVSNLKDIIVATYEMLQEHGQGRLGVGPRRQLDILKLFLKKSG